MAIDDLEIDGNPAADAFGLEGRDQPGEAPSAEQGAPSGLEAVRGPGAAQVVEQRGRTRIRQREPVDVEHGLAQPRREQRVADVVHVGKGMHVRTRVDPAPGRTQLAQAVGTQGREQEDAVLAQYSRDFAEQPGGPFEPGQEHVREDDVDAVTRERQLPGVGTHQRRPGQPRAPSSSCGQHARRQVTAGDERTAKALLERCARLTRGAAQVEDRLGGDGHRREACEQAATGQAVDAVRVSECGRSAVEVALDQRLVEPVGIARSVHVPKLTSFSGANEPFRRRQVPPPGVDNPGMSWRLHSGRVVHQVTRAARKVVAALLPRLCVFCGIECGPGEDRVCAACERDLPWLGPHCPRCAEPLPEALLSAAGCGACQISPPPFTVATAPLRYAFPVDAAIRAVKFHRRLEYVPAFAAILHARFAALPADIDALLPVPLHWRRQLRRGFNQALELCAPLAAATGLPMLESIVRVRSTPYQSGLDAARRRRSLRGAFAVRRPLAARHVLIIDDVMTTGATCGELAHAVIGAGASEVSVMALARAVQAGLNT